MVSREEATPASWPIRTEETLLWRAEEATDKLTLE